MKQFLFLASFAGVLAFGSGCAHHNCKGGECGMHKEAAPACACGKEECAKAGECSCGAECKLKNAEAARTVVPATPATPAKK